MLMTDRIDILLQEKKMSKRELERKAGISVGSVSKWTKVNPNQNNVQKVAEVLNVSVAFLTGESEFRSEHEAVLARWTAEAKEGLADEVRRIEAGIRIPVLGCVPCGIPMEAIEMYDSSEWEEISERLAHTGNFFGLKVKGDSMSPRIQEGDVLIVKQQSDIDSGDVAVVRIDDNEACCKKVIKYPDHIVLQSFNLNYEPMVFAPEQVQILGKVVENRQKF